MLQTSAILFSCRTYEGEEGGENGTAYQEESGKNRADEESIHYSEDARNDNNNSTVHSQQTAHDYTDLLNKKTARYERCVQEICVT